MSIPRSPPWGNSYQLNKNNSFNPTYTTTSPVTTTPTSTTVITTTASTLNATTTATTSYTKIVTTPVTTTSNNNILNETTNTIIQQTKRTRTSPEKSNQTKAKKLRNQSTLKKYWLNQPANPEKSENRFEILAADDETEECTDTPADKDEKEMRQTIPKPPPIYVQSVKYIHILIDALNTTTAKDTYILKVLPNDEIKIQPTDSVTYTKIIKVLKLKNTQYYTFKPKELRGFRVMLRNMHHSTDLNEIKKELADLNHKVINVHNITQRGTKKTITALCHRTGKQ